MASVGPVGYYEMDAKEWLDWAMSTVQTRTWVGLTDEEIQECLKGLPTQTIDVYARRIEAKLKERNHDSSQS